MKKTTLFNSDENRIEKAKRWLRLLSISTAFFVGQSVFGQDVGTIQIGSGTSTITGTNAIPVTNYVSSYSQQIVTAAEYASGGGAAGEITKLRYYPTNVGTVTVWNNLTVYIGNTTKTAFSSTTDWVPLTELTQVFSGVITPDPVSNSWFEIVFTAPFDYTGGNIVIAVDENTPNWTTAPTFRSYTSTANSGIMYRSDTENPDPASPPTATARVSALPQIQFEGTLASCVAPLGLVSANVTATTADVSWDPSGSSSAVGYEYVISTSNTVPTGPGTSSGSSAETFVQLDNLWSQTVYYLFVRTDCGSGSFSEWSLPISFTTLCSSVSSFTEGFESTTGTNFPSCWFKVGATGTANTQASTGFGSTRSLYMYSSTSTSRAVVSLPPVNNADADTHRMVMKVRANFTVGETIELGYLTNPADASTFMALNSIVTNSTTVPQTFSTTPTGLPSGDVVFALRTGTALLSVLIDDVTWEPIPLCPDQTGLVVANITSDGAETSWDDMSANGATGYEYAVTTSATPPVSGAATTDTFYVASTLASNTVHYLHVRTSCSGGQFGNWTSISFRTLCAAVTAPTVAETFTTYLPSCWSEATGALTASSTLNNVDGAWISYQFAGVSTSNMGTKVNLYGGSTATPDNDWMISSPIDLGSTPGLYRVKYKSALTSYNGTTAQTNLGTHVVKVVVSTDGGATWSDSNVIKTYSGTYTPTSSETIDLTAYSGVVKIGFVATSTSLSPDIDFHIDDFIVEAIPSCPDVTGLVVSSITSDSASTSWDDMSASGATGYEYAVTTTVTPPASGTATTDTFYLASGLDSNTVHYLHVRTDCGSGSFGNWVTTSFTTLCSSVTSFTEGFETTTGALFPSCWSKVGGSGSAYTQASTGISGARNVYMYSSSATSRPVVAMIPVSNASAGTHRMVMKVRANFTAGETIELGYLTTPTDATTFTPINSIVTNSTTVPQSFITIPSGLPSGDVVFALRTGTALLSVLIDDVSWEPLPLCPDQTGLVVANVTSNSASTSWDDMSGNGATGYEYAVTTTATPPTSGTATTDTFYEATSLVSNTVHYLHVRSICSGGEFGNWATLSFTTLVAPSTIPWNENFDVTGTPGGWTTNGYTVAAANASIGFPASIKFGDGTTNVIRRNSWEFSTTGSFTTNSAGEIAAGQVLSFNYKLINYPDDNQPSVGSGNYTVEISIDNGATYDLVETVTNDGVAGWQTKTYPLDAYVGEFIKVKITDTWSGTDVDADYFIGFDNFYIGEELSSPSFDKSALKVYPNPTRNILYVNYNQEISNVEVYNLVGQRVANITPNANEGQIDMSNLASGAYFVKVTSNNATRTVKVIKE
ncbi:T9SS type A sorting domain-containing protein [Flavobacterium solisilvae]|uniref:T9SS type A sorting domain-containing protein n=1 Tax=Flavobacterium solisilvae TaxID=1852019 RepID=A0ABX1QVP1_9FLAO|nr:T9SS type A sorting domain-containing protein [Flavobacterium solisilvae]NMH26345.1 T9SS type A sorting domain-containing protein [Flavobacterium solisilvae]